ncbi:MAG: exo-alpha-sialidase [Kofleriaceae bacterium]|nr:exo-alpha-sialidase [Kofleriaceae bacterium]
MPSPILPGGYCASACGIAEHACDGACIATARVGEVCAARCATDDDCRVDEGYVCDRQWHACLVPNFAAVVPAAGCPSTNGRDLAFGPAETWSTANAPGLYQVGPSAVISDDGSVTAMFMARSGNREGSALAISRSDGAIDVPFKSQRANHEAPWLARDRKGTLYAAWLGYDTHELGQEIGLARSTDRGATWSSPVAVHDPADCEDGERDCLGKPMLAIGDALYVLYGTRRGGLHVRASLDGGATFSAPVTALVGDHGTATVGPDGTLHVVTISGSPLGAFGSAMQRIEYTASTDHAATFAKSVAVSADEEVLPYYFANPAIAVDAKRKLVHVVYVRGGRDGRWDLVLATSKDRGATWTRTRLAGDGCAIHMAPSVALDDKTGTLHVAYYDNEGGAGRFVHASCTPGRKAMQCVQHGAISSAPFAAFSTVRHAPTWLGDYESLVVDTKRRTLHAVWTQPVLDEGVVKSRIFHAQAPLPK